MRKYASWMRELEFLDNEDEISQHVFDALLRRPHSAPICPRLVKLSWVADSVFGGDFVHFLSPQLREVHLASRVGTQFSFAHAISTLPISSLEAFDLSVIGDRSVREAVSSLFRTCPKNLTTLKVTHMDQLCDGSWSNIMVLLPRLRNLDTDQFPPTLFPHSAPMFFPSLHQATFRGPAAPRWIHFLSENNGQKVPSDTKSRLRIIAPRLRLLYCDSDLELDAAFVSRFRIFRNLCVLRIGGGCSREACAFSLTDEDVSRLAMQLPGLRHLALGIVCPHNRCMTTVNSLLSLSTHCKDLHELWIHFNTRNFARDMKDSLHNAFRRTPSRCSLTILDVWLAPLTSEAMGGGEVFPTLIGLVDIFPKLQKIRHCSRSPPNPWGWQQLDAQIANFQEMRNSLPAVFAQSIPGPQDPRFT